jgi:hypothetical protein
MKRDILIELVGMFVLMVTMILCTAFLSMKQARSSFRTQEVLYKMYDLEFRDLAERKAHRGTIDTRLTSIETGLQIELDRQAAQQLLLDALAKKLHAERK